LEGGNSLEADAKRKMMSLIEEKQKVAMAQTPVYMEGAPVGEVGGRSGHDTTSAEHAGGGAFVLPQQRWGGAQGSGAGNSSAPAPLYPGASPSAVTKTAKWSTRGNTPADSNLVDTSRSVSLWRQGVQSLNFVASSPCRQRELARWRKFLSYRDGTSYHC
jgi:hypothetical protein